MSQPSQPTPPDDLPPYDWSEEERPREPPSPSRLPALALVAVIALAAGAAIWHFGRILLGGAADDNRTVVSRAPEPARTIDPPPSAAPAVQHPIDAAPALAQAPLDEAAKLPALADSDTVLWSAVGTLVDPALAGSLLVTSDLVRRFVVTVDNLPREHVALRLRSVKATPGAYQVERSAGVMRTADANAARYDAFLRLIESMDSRRAVALYAQFYPLFQQEYRALGYPDKYFNDRLVQAIDHLLSTPDEPARPELVQPKVLYQYAEPSLESLSAGRKMMLRLGPAHATRVKAKLRALRRDLVSASPGG